MDRDKNSQIFLSLIYSFQMQCMVHLGKIKNPGTDTIERDMAAAQMTIDMMDMLKDKTKGNLSDDEQKFLDNVTAELKLNYVDESSKEDKTLNP